MLRLVAPDGGRGAEVVEARRAPLPEALAREAPLELRDVLAAGADRQRDARAQLLDRVDREAPHPSAPRSGRRPLPSRAARATPSVRFCERHGPARRAARRDAELVAVGAAERDRLRRRASPGAACGLASLTQPRQRRGRLSRRTPRTDDRSTSGGCESTTTFCQRTRDTLPTGSRAVIAERVAPIGETGIDRERARLGTFRVRRPPFQRTTHRRALLGVPVEARAAAGRPPCRRARASVGACRSRSRSGGRCACRRSRSIVPRCARDASRRGSPRRAGRCRVDPSSRGSRRRDRRPTTRGWPRLAGVPHEQPDAPGARCGIASGPRRSTSTCSEYCEPDVGAVAAAAPRSATPPPMMSVSRRTAPRVPGSLAPLAELSEPPAEARRAAAPAPGAPPRARSAATSSSRRAGDRRT